MDQQLKEATVVGIGGLLAILIGIWILRIFSPHKKVQINIEPVQEPEQKPETENDFGFNFDDFYEDELEEDDSFIPEEFKDEETEEETEPEVEDEDDDEKIPPQITLSRGPETPNDFPETAEYVKTIGILDHVYSAKFRNVSFAIKVNPEGKKAFNITEGNINAAIEGDKWMSLYEPAADDIMNIYNVLYPVKGE